MRTDLVALPYAGGGVTTYRGWDAALPDATLHAVTLPGHGHRVGEELLTSLDPVVDDVVAQLAAAGVGAAGGDPWMVFGHSMGALVGYELARRTTGTAPDGGPTLAIPPAGLVVSGLDAPPRLAGRRQARHELPDGELTEVLRAYGGTPPELLENDAVLRFFLPPLRADLGVVDTYRYRPGPPLPIPVAAYLPTSDPGMSFAGAQAWEGLTQAGFRLRSFAGDHFYLLDGAPVCRALQDDVRWVRGPARAAA